MREWENYTSYSKGDKERKPRTWSFNVTQNIKIIVHKYIGYGDEWLITCREIGIEMVETKTTDIQEATEMALQMVHSRLSTLADEYKRAALSIEDMYNGDIDKRS